MKDVKIKEKGFTLKTIHNSLSLAPLRSFSIGGLVVFGEAVGTFLETLS